MIEDETEHGSLHGAYFLAIITFPSNSNRLGLSITPDSFFRPVF